MKKTLRILFVVAVVALALFTMLPEASAVDWCQECQQDPDCWSCCRCNGGTVNACLRACGG